LPSYSVITADTLRDVVTLTFDRLTVVSGHTTLSPSRNVLRLSIFEL